MRGEKSGTGVNVAEIVTSTSVALRYNGEYEMARIWRTGENAHLTGRWLNINEMSASIRY